jgi:hypothetical protein
VLPPLFYFQTFQYFKQLIEKGIIVYKTAILMQFIPFVWRAAATRRRFAFV